MKYEVNSLKRGLKWACIPACTIFLSACGGGGSIPPTTFTATFTPSTLNLTSSAGVKNNKATLDSDQIMIQTSTVLTTTPTITFEDVSGGSKAKYFGVTNCKTVQNDTTCDVTDIDPVTEKDIQLKVMVSAGGTTVQATPADGSADQNITINTTYNPTPPPPHPTPTPTPCSFDPGSTNPCPFPARTNSAWLYDGKITCTGLDISVQKQGVKKDKWIDPNATCSYEQTPGADAQDVLTFNNAIQLATKSTTTGLNEVNVYAGDIEFNNDDSSPFTQYKLQQTDNANEVAYDGYKNITAYYKALHNQGITKFMAVVDGRHDALGVPNGWLWASSTYNNGLISNNIDYLKPADAVKFADHIAEQFCDGSDAAAAEIDGVQFDLEHFQLPPDTETIPAVCDPGSNSFDPSSEECATPTFLKQGWGQFMFYREIGKDFAGYNPALASSTICTPKHPKFFTLFNYPDPKAEKHLAEMLNGYKNGYSIFSLYDIGGDGKVVPYRQYNGSDITMGTARAGFVASSSTYFKQSLAKEIAAIKEQIQNDPIHFQVGIPGAASAHEFAYSESPAYDTGKVDDRYAISEPAKTGDPIYPACATSEEVLATGDKDCAFDATSAATYQANIVEDALKGTQTLLDELGDNSKYYIGMNLWAFNPSNTSAVSGSGQVLANNHWIPRASATDSKFAFPKQANIPNGPDGTQVSNQNKFVICGDQFDKLARQGLTGKYTKAIMDGGCSETAVNDPTVAPQPFPYDDPTSDIGYSHTPNEYVGMRFYYPNSMGIGELKGTNPDVASENEQEKNVLGSLTKFPDLLKLTSFSQK